jgi:hypothetical protein
MYTHSMNRLTTVSSALAVAGILTCVAALLDVAMPHGSLAAFLASMVLLGLAVTGVMIGFTWACDKCESYVDGRLDRILGFGTPDRKADANPRAVAARPELKVISDRVTAPGELQFSASHDRHAPTFRGPVSPANGVKADTRRAWHGQ